MTVCLASAGVIPQLYLNYLLQDINESLSQKKIFKLIAGFSREVKALYVDS